MKQSQWHQSFRSKSGPRTPDEATKRERKRGRVARDRESAGDEAQQEIAKKNRSHVESVVRHVKQIVELCAHVAETKQQRVRLSPATSEHARGEKRSDSASCRNATQATSQPRAHTDAIKPRCKARTLNDGFARRRGHRLNLLQILDLRRQHMTTVAACTARRKEGIAVLHQTQAPSNEVARLSQRKS